MDANNLSDRHLQMLQSGSVISLPVIEARGYRTVTAINDLTELGFNREQARNVPGLLIPLHSTDGQQPLCVYRPDNPRLVDGKKLPDGTREQKTIKYEFPAGQSMRLDCPPPCLAWLKDKSKPLYITEGQKKADALASQGLCALALLGVWNFKGGNDHVWLPDWDHVTLAEREIYLVFDSDVMTKHQVGLALRRLTGILSNKKANVTPILLPPLDNGKCGIDDYFASGKTVNDLMALVAASKTWFAPVLKQSQQNQPNKYNDYLDALSLLGYDFRLNTLDDSMEVNGERITDEMEAKIRSQLRDAGYSKELNAIRDAYTRYAYDHGYHPVRKYLNDLVWSGEPSIAKLSAHFTDQDGVFGLWLRRWLIGAVAKAFTGSQNYMLVLDGAQGIGKSRFAAYIGSCLPEYFVEGPIQPENKDFVLRMANKFIWEVSELGGTTRKADREALKAFITMQTIVARKPYGRHDIKKPALASLIGTINDEAGFLNDPTGSRRFLTCTLTKIDFGYNAVDINDVWAEAVAAWRNGELWYLTKDEAERQSSLNAYYECEDPMETSIKRNYVTVDPQLETWIATADILRALGLDENNAGHARRVSTLLKKMGCTRDRAKLANGQRVNGWLGLRPCQSDGPLVAVRDIAQPVAVNGNGNGHVHVDMSELEFDF